MKNAINENNNQVDKELKHFDEILEAIAQLHSQIDLLTERIADLYVYGEDQTAIQTELQQLERNVNEVCSDSQTLIQRIQDTYSKQQGFVPIDISNELKSLELAAENIKGIMADKDREFKRAKTVRSEYLNGVDFIRQWVQQAELRIQDRTIEPVRLKEIITDVQKELTGIYDKLDTVKQCAMIIVDNSHSDDEKRLIQNTVDQLEKQIEQLRTELEDKKHQLHDSVDAYTRFMKLYEIVMKWAADKKQFINISLNVTTMAECRQKMNEYMVGIRLYSMQKQKQIMHIYTNIHIDFVSILFSFSFSHSQFGMFVFIERCTKYKTNRKESQRNGQRIGNDRASDVKRRLT